MTKHVEQEEIVQLALANQVPSSSPRRSRRQQLREPVCPERKNEAISLLPHAARAVIDKVTTKGSLVPEAFTPYMDIWSPSYCRPTKRQLGKVACANDHAAHLVGNVHQNWCALWCGPGVFVHNVVNVLVVAYVGEVLHQSTMEISW